MPSEIASWPLAESTRTLGRKFGETRSGPRSRRICSCSRIPLTPPIAVPNTTPTRAGSKPFRLASSLPSGAAASARRTFRSSFRTSFADATWVASKSLTSAATRTGSPSTSNERIQSMPLRPATAACQVAFASLPIGVTAPRPVTATRLIFGRLRIGRFGHTNQRFLARAKSSPFPNHWRCDMAVAAPALEREQPRLVFFHSALSGHCRRVEGFLAQVLQRRRNHGTFEVVRVSEEDRPDLLQHFKIDTVPTLVVVEGRAVAGRLEKPRGCRDIEGFLAPWLS